MLGHNGQDGSLLDFSQTLAQSLAHSKHAQCFHFPSGSSWIVLILVFTGSMISKQIKQCWSYSMTGLVGVAALAAVLFLYVFIFKIAIVDVYYVGLKGVKKFSIS
jgi:hypothetical protein